MLLSEKENSIYKQLYDITSKNFDGRYGTLQGSKGAFIASVNLEPHRTDLSVLADVPIDDFLEASYFSVLRRFPDATAAEIWKQKRPTMSEETYKEKVVFSLINSRERSIRGVTVYNNIFSQVQKQNGIVANTVVAQPAYPGLNRLYKIYYKLPKWLKSLVKALLK